MQRINKLEALSLNRKARRALARANGIAYIPSINKPYTKDDKSKTV